MNRFVKYFLCLMGIAGVIVLDRQVKLWAVENLKNTSGRGLIPNVVSLTYTENAGAAFGILQGMRWVFVGLAVVAVIAIIWIILKERIEKNTLLIGFSLMISGAVGNMIDRAFDGYVVDMFKLEFINFAIFNVADIALTCGGVMTCIYILVKKRI